MQRLALCLGLLCLGGLALTTTALNVEAWLKAYRIGGDMREADDLRARITFNVAHARRLASTDRLITLLAAHNMTVADLYPETVDVDSLGSIAMGAP